VTGAGGFIGSHLVDRLVARGYRVRAFVRYNSRSDRGYLAELEPQVASEVEIVAGDLKDPEAVTKAVDGCEIVFHLGALIAIPYSYVHPIDVVQTNVVGTANVLSACRRSPALRRLVHTSTSEVYGTARYVPIDEQHPLQGQSPYSASKIGADMLATSYHLSFRVPVVTLRPFNTYGPRQSLRAVVPTIISQALAGGPVRLGALTPRRDLTFVSDTIEGFLCAAGASAAVGETINLGTGEDISIGNLVQLILKLLGKKLDVVVDQARLRPEASEVMCLQASNEKAKAILGWSPTISLESGLRRTIEWMSTRSEQYQSAVYHV
jgi:dTDP-glucose 4,6-dehydratase